MIKLLSPRLRARALDDLGERSSLVGGQRVGRASRRRARARGRIALAVAILVAAGASAAATTATVGWVLSSPRFAVTTIEVRGAVRLTRGRIVEAAALPAGTNLFRVDPIAIATRVQALPEVRRADVVRELPNRVTVVVEERRPFTLVHSGRLHWVDEDGRAAGEERHAVAPGVPLITGLDEDEVAAMQKAPGVKAQGAIALIRALLRSGSRLVAEIAEIDVGQSGGPVLYTLDGVEVRLGTEDWSDRLARLEGVLAQVTAEESQVTVVDLRFRDQVVLRRGGQL